MRGVLGGILADDSLTISTEGNKKCLEIAKSLVQCYGSVHTCTEASLEFACWLVATLNAVTVASCSKKANLMN